jgi:hypothetical protein
MNSDTLYRELKPDVEAIGTPLFEASQIFIKNRGQFLPHGAVLASSGETSLVMAGDPEFAERAVSSMEVLPLLHDALREEAKRNDVRAVAVCEDVRITLDGQAETAAIKVVLEHVRGLCVALYVPWRRDKFHGYIFEDILSKLAEPEVGAWPTLAN